MATAWREPAFISRKGCSCAGRGWPKRRSHASGPIPIMQERFASMSRKPTARTSAERSLQNERTAARLPSVGPTVATTKMAARVNARTTGCERQAEPVFTWDVVNGAHSVLSAGLKVCNSSNGISADWIGRVVLIASVGSETAVPAVPSDASTERPGVVSRPSQSPCGDRVLFLQIVPRPPLEGTSKDCTGNRPLRQ